MYQQRRILVLVLVCLLISLGLAAPSLAATRLRVGVYNNPPMQNIPASGIPEGFVIDILENISQKEGWEITYIPCSWDECLQKIETGEIDLMGAIAYSEARAERFDFSHETLINNWGHVYAQTNGQLESIFDLAGKSIAVLHNDIHATALETMLASFGIAAEFIEVENYAAVFAMIADAEVDAGVVNHFYALQYADEYQLHPSPIIFNPIEVRFAATKGVHTVVLETIDDHLSAAKTKNNSFYFMALNTWFGGTHINQELPAGAFRLAYGITGAALFLLFTSLMLRHQVRLRTRELTESQERLDLAIRGTDVGLWDWNIDTGVSIINEKWAAMSGYTLDELNPLSIETWDRMVHPDDLAESKRRLQAHFSGENEQYESEFRIRHKSGHWIWVLDRGRVFQRAKDGHPIRMTGTQLEITQRKQAEAELAYNKWIFQSILEQSVEGIGVADLDGNYILVNAAYCKLTGYVETELLGMNLRDLVPKEIDLTLFSKVQRGESGIDITTLQRKDGSTFIAEVSGAAIQMGAQRLILGIVRDISQRILQDQALRESEEHFRGLSEATFEAIFISENGVCLEQNLAAEKMFGYTQDEAIGKLAVEWIAPEGREFIAQKIRSGDEGPYRVTALRKDGSTFLCEIHARMMEYRGHTVRVTALRDITQQVGAEQALEQHTEELTALYKTTLDIIAPHKLPELLKTIVQRAVDLLKGASGGMYLVEEDQQHVRCVVSYNTARDYSGVVLKYGEGAAGKVAATGESLIIDDYRFWQDRAKIYEDEQPFSAVISVPMRWQNRITGVIHVINDTETRRFNDDDMALLNAFANQAAIAVENTRLLDELQNHASDLEARVRDRTAELQIIVNAMSGREVRMAELKGVIRKLRKQLEDAGLKPTANDPLLEPYSGDTPK